MSKKTDDLMNAIEYYLKINTITIHHTFIKLLTKRETMSDIAFSFHQYNIFIKFWNKNLIIFTIKALKDMSIMR